MTVKAIEDRGSVIAGMDTQYLRQPLRRLPRRVHPVTQ